MTDEVRKNQKNSDNRVRAGFTNKKTNTNVYADLPGPTQKVTDGIWITLTLTVATAIVGSVVHMFTKETN